MIGANRLNLRMSAQTKAHLNGVRRFNWWMREIVSAAVLLCQVRRSDSPAGPTWRGKSFGRSDGKVPLVRTSIPHLRFPFDPGDRFLPQLAGLAVSSWLRGASVSTSYIYHHRQYPSEETTKIIANRHANVGMASRAIEVTQTDGSVYAGNTRPDPMLLLYKC